MRLLPRTRGIRNGLVGATLLALLLSVGAQTGVAASGPVTTADLQAWHLKMAKVPQPSAKGCFTADYPKMVWRVTECAAPPTAPMQPRPPGSPVPLNVGDGNDVVAQTPGANIFQAFGTFENVTGVTSVSSPINNTGPAVPNAYTLQLNTNYFATPACVGALNPALCQGWQQFVFANDGTSGRVYIEYWLLVYNAFCPAGFTPYIIGGNIYCRMATPAAIVPGNTPITAMPTFQLSGDVSGAVDIVIMQIGASLYATAGSSIVDAAPGWVQAEFNVFGYGGNSLGGSQAVFNPGASTRVRTRINNGAPTAPICNATGFTAESNNLLFGVPAPSASGLGPAVLFLENSIGGAATSCAAAVSVGDTHQRTFAGLFYDFQASGDFVEAQVGTSFEVQSRKASGAPSWPNASVNKSVATRMGNNQVAVCDGTRLVVNGVTTALNPGAMLSVPGGVTVHRTGNTYLVRDLSGNSVQIAAMGLYTNLDVGLGTWPTVVRGLLGNPNNNPNLLEAKDGTQFSIPISFTDLYQRFGNSWRVSSTSSLLAVCNPTQAGNPSAPFFADNLEPQLRQQADTVCRRAGVAQIWIDTCVLDVAVVGQQGANVFVGMTPPVVNGNRPQR